MTGMRKTANKKPYSGPSSAVTVAGLLLGLLLFCSVCVYGQQEKGSLSEKVIRKQVVMLRSRYHADREAAVEALVSAGAGAAGFLEEAARSANPQERACALRALCQVSPERAADPVVGAVIGNDANARLAAVKAAYYLDIKGLQILVARVPAVPPEKRDILRLLVHTVRRKKVKDILSKIAGSREGEGQFPGQYKEITRHGSFVEPPLSEVAANRQLPLARHAAAALGELGDKAAIPALKKVYALASGELRQTAAASLHILGEDGPYKEVEMQLRKDCIGPYDNKENYERAYTVLALFYDSAREYKAGERKLRELIAKFGGQGIDHMNLACLLSVQNKVEEAYAEFVKGVGKGYTDMEWVKIDGELANLRATKRFKSFVRKRFPGAFEEAEPEKQGEEKK